MQQNKKIAVIGAGFSGLSAAAYLAAAGYSVTVFEKHGEPGGRGRSFSTPNGYTFDMGPSWYWMPDVYERWFADFGYQASDWYQLKRLDPSFEIVFDGAAALPVPDEFSHLCALFETLETGAGARLAAFMRDAQYKYEKAMETVIYKPGLSFTELLDRRLIASATRLQLFSSFRREVRKYFRHPHLVALMEFPVLFLGAMPKTTPALYTLMNYAGLKLGTWYPMGGFGSVVRAMAGVAEKQGVGIRYNSTVDRICVSDGVLQGLVVNGAEFHFDAVVASADYHYVEEHLLPPEYRNYTEAYWEKKTFAPSSLIYYVGVRKKIPRLPHHTLFFDQDLDQHAADIYTNKKWPEKPLFYVCRTSASDGTVAPQGCDNLFLLMPIANGLADTEPTREHYFTQMLGRLERHAGEEIGSFIEFKRSYCIRDFIGDYGAYKGNAYGLANTLMQTAMLKPGIRNKKLPTLVYTGQLTVPGPGVPPAIISGKIAAGVLIKVLRTKSPSGSGRSRL